MTRSNRVGRRARHLLVAGEGAGRVGIGCSLPGKAGWPVVGRVRAGVGGGGARAGGGRGRRGAGGARRPASALAASNLPSRRVRVRTSWASKSATKAAKRSRPMVV